MLPFFILAPPLVPVILGRWESIPSLTFAAVYISPRLKACHVSPPSLMTTFLQSLSMQFLM